MKLARDFLAQTIVPFKRNGLKPAYRRALNVETLTQTGPLYRREVDMAR
jgi:hypothetical protein